MYFIYNHNFNNTSDMSCLTAQYYTMPYCTILNLYLSHTTLLIFKHRNLEREKIIDATNLQ